MSKSENNIDMSVLEDCVRDTLGELVREESVVVMINSFHCMYWNILSIH